MKSFTILCLFVVFAVVTASPAVRRVKILRSQRQMAPVYGPPPEEPIPQPSEQVPPQVDETITGLSPPTEAPRKEEPKMEEPEEEEIVPMMMQGNNFFPINLGRSGGSVAIGNSFATGKGGKAESHATAYGGPSARLETAPDGYNYDRPTPSFEEEPTELPSETVTETITTTEAVTEAETEVVTEAIAPTTAKPIATPRPKKKSPRKNPSFGLGNFFPITFGRSGFPFGSTAIANSFSTGRNGIANSHATSFGATSARLQAPPQGTMLVGFYDESMKQPKFFTFQMGQNMEETQPEEPQETQPEPAATQPEETLVDDSEEDDDSEEEFDFGLGKSGGAFYNFFPIRFGGRPDSAAIANSFSTGRKGQANSQATSNGKSARLEEAPKEEQPEEQPQEDAQDEPEDEPQDDESSDVEEELIPSRKPSGHGFTFFPIVFAGFERNSGNGISSTAIANSFSTGKKGTATSHATSYGSGKSARLETPPEETAETATEITEVTTEAVEEITEAVETTTEVEVTTAKVDAPVPRRRTKSKPVNNFGSGFAFFPINFGGRSGGSVSIANSFSTGKNGAANSFSTSYGSRSKRQTDDIPEDLPQEIPENLPEDLPAEEEDDQIPEDNPLLKGFGGNPFYNFFPINFSYGGKSDGGNNPGTVAIANSFSTGRGGVANSQATAYGFGFPKDRN